MKKKKIKVVHYLPSMINGGIESMLLNYCTKLCDTFDFVFIINGTFEDKCYGKFKRISSKIYQVPYWKHNFFKHNRILFDILKKEKPMIFHVHFGIANFLACFIAQLSGIKIRISHCHTYKPSKNLKEKVFTFLSKLFATNNVACGKGAAEFLVGKKQIDSVKVLYNAIDLKKYKYSEKKRNEIRQKYGILDKKIYGNVGRFSFQKNQLFLIDIFEEIYRRDNESYFFIIGGNDNEYDQVISKLNSSTIKDNCIILKDINNVYDYYSAFDVLLLPSLYEGFAVTVVEAQASSLPCILSPTITKEFNSNCIFFAEDLINYKKWADISMKDYKINRNSNIVDLSKFDINKSYLDMSNLYKSCLGGDKFEK